MIYYGSELLVKIMLFPRFGVKGRGPCDSTWLRLLPTGSVRIPNVFMCLLFLSLVHLCLGASITALSETDVGNCPSGAERQSTGKLYSKGLLSSEHWTPNWYLASLCEGSQSSGSAIKNRIVEMDILTERLREGDIDKTKDLWEIFYELLDGYYG